MPRCACSWLPLLIVTILLTPLAYAVEDDLNVTLIERTPKYDYDATKNMPAPGDVVTFHGHIRYWGDESTPVQPVGAVAYQWKIDGEVVQSSVIGDPDSGVGFEPLRPPFDFDYAGYPNPTDKAALRNPAYWPKNPEAFPTSSPPTGWRVVTLPWVWQDGEHTVELIVDPYNTIAEKSEKNNSIKQRTDAIMAGFWVEESMWTYFHEHQDELGPTLGSNSWEDWIQRQMAKQNQLYEAAIWPNAPDGVLTRVRIDRIIVVPDGYLPLNGGLPSNNPDTSDKTIDLAWGFATSLLSGTMYSNTTSTSEGNAFYIEQSLIHELGHARYLIDSYGFDVHNTSSYDSVQIYEGDTYVAGSAYMPFVAFGEVLHYNQNGGVMSGPYGFQWSPYEAGALNLIAYDRATCGNMNAPCNIGVYLQNLPQANHMQMVDAYGWQRPAADVRVYNATSGPGWYGKTFDNTPDQYYTADAAGWITMPRNPFNPGGTISHTYGLANSVMILRVQQGTQIWYRFVEASDFNMQYWAGNTEDGFYTLELDGANDDSDGDGLPDFWELEYFGDLTHNDTEDYEPDGLTNFEEMVNHTSPIDEDTDDDGLNDGPEVVTWHTDPLNPDTDGDGLEDGAEVDLGADPLDTDSDDDGFLDGADNCPATYNPDQADWNNDGIGDACAPGPKLALVMAVNPTSVTVQFDQAVEQTSAETPGNYLIDPAVAVLAAALQTDGRTVLLTTGTLTAGQTYTLYVSNVTDLADPPNVMQPNSAAEFEVSTGGRQVVGLVGLYTFDAGSGTTVYDESGVLPTTDLTISNEAAVTWTIGGLSFDTPAMAATPSGATKYYNSLTGSNAMTVEAWLIPDNTSQHGPATIATMASSYARNFTLGQGEVDGGGSAYSLRLRTSTTGTNGALVSTPTGVAKTGLQHVVATRTADGLTRIYVDGQIALETTISGTFSNWSSSYRFGVGSDSVLTLPWLGELRLVAIYNRALSAADVQQNRSAGPDAPLRHTGDLNCDGEVNFFDIDPFVVALTGFAAYQDNQPGCNWYNADCNVDDHVDFFDIDPFVVLLAQ